MNLDKRYAWQAAGCQRSFDAYIRAIQPADIACFTTSRLALSSSLAYWRGLQASARLQMQLSYRERQSSPKLSCINRKGESGLDWRGGGSAKIGTPHFCPKFSPNLFTTSVFRHIWGKWGAPTLNIQTPTGPIPQFRWLSAFWDIVLLRPLRAMDVRAFGSGRLPNFYFLAVRAMARTFWGGTRKSARISARTSIFLNGGVHVFVSLHILSLTSYIVSHVLWSLHMLFREEGRGTIMDMKPLEALRAFGASKRASSRL